MTQCPPLKAIEKGDTFYILYPDLSLSDINALKAVEEICAQNTTLTQEVIALEEHNCTLCEIIRKMDELAAWKDKPTHYCRMV